MRLYALVVFGAAAPFRGASLPSNFVMVSVCVGLPCASTPSVVILKTPPSADSHLDELLFTARFGGSYLDFARFCFQLPISGSDDCPATGTAVAKRAATPRMPAKVVRLRIIPPPDLNKFLKRPSRLPPEGSFCDPISTRVPG